MAYGLKYSQYLEKGGVRLQIKVYQKDYTGASYGMAHITGAALQVVGGQSDILSPTLKTAFSWSLADCWDEGTTQADGTTCVDATGQKCGKWEEFYTPDATKYKVELSVLPDGGTASVIWTGFVTPDSWSENLIYRGSVTITARDMLGALRDREFSLTGRVSVLDIVQGALAACECPMALSYTAGHFLVNADGSSILDHSFAASAFSGDTWQTALDETLESLGLVLRYNGVNGLVLTSYRYIKADTLRGMHGGEFTGRSGLRALDPAIKEIVDVFDVDFVSYNAPDPKEEQFSRTGGTITCSMGSGSQAATGQLYAYNLTRADGEGWAGNLAIPLYGTISAGVQARGLFFPTNVQDTQNNIEATYINPRIDGGFKFSIEQDGPLVLSRNGATSSATFLPYTGAIAVSNISVRVEVTSGGTTSYLQPEGGWTNELTYLTIQPGEEVEVPVHNSGGTYRIVVKKVRSAGIMDNVRPVAPLLAALLLNIAPPANSTSTTEYKVTTIYNEDNNVAINRTPSVGSAGLGGCVDFYENVLALGDTLAANQWNWPGESDYYPLAVMVQAQVLCYYSAAASVFTGTLHDTTADDAPALPGYGVSYYQRDCVSVNATYDFVSGLVGQSTFREVYTWEQVWGASFAPQYTQRSGAGRGSTSATGAGGSSVNPGGGGGYVPGGGTNYWEIDGTLNTLLKPKDAYAYVHSKDGLFFTGATLSGTVVPDLYVDTVNNQRVLRSPLPLITGGDQIVLDGTPGGGGGGGGATTLAGLDDTNITNPTETEVLQYLDGKWKNVPSSAVGVTTPATSSANGLMSAEDYNKLAGVAEGATAVNESTVAGWGFTKNTGTVTSVKVGSTTYNPTSGLISLPAYLTAHQTVTLASGTNNGTLKLTTAAGTVDNIAVKGLGSIAYKATSDYLAYSTERASSTNAIDLNNYTSSENGEMKLLSWDNAGAQYAANRPVTSSRAASLYVLPNRWGGMQLYVDYNSSVYYLRNKYNDWTSWVQLYHSGNANKSDVAWTCSSLTANGAVSAKNASQVVLSLNRSDNNYTAIEFLGKVDGTADVALGRIGYNTSGAWVRDASDTAYRLIYHQGNANKSDVPWACSTLTASGLATLTGGASIPATSSLKIGSATITWNSNGYLHIDKPLVTAGDQIVISGTPGGGGGGGATTLNGLDDVSVSSLANNNVLVWDSTLRSGQGAWKNVAASSIGGVTSVVGQTGAVTAEQIASALTSAGYQLTDTTYSQGTGISISGTTISLASTYAGGTAVTLNGVSKAANTASFYAPAAGGAANKVLIGKGTTTAPEWSGFTLTGTANTAYNLANFLTGNQTITLSGDVSGSGTTSINVSIGSGKVTNAMLAGSIAWSKLSVSASDLTSLIGSSTYAPYNANGYLPLNGGTLTGEVELSHTLANAASIKYTNKRATTSAGNWGDVILNIADADGTAMSRMGIYGSQNNLSYLYIGSNAASGVNLRISSTALTWGDNTIWHAGNFVAGTNYQAPMSQGTGITISNNQISVTANTYAPYNANGYLPLNGGTLSGLLLLNYANARIAFQDGSGTTLGALGVRSANTLEFYDTAWRTVWHANNSNLSTVDWTTKILNVNGRLYMKGGNAIEFDNASGTSRGLLSATDSKELQWHDGSWRTVYHSNNANKSDVAWTCSTLTIHSDTTSHGNIYLDNSKYIVGTLADGTTTANLLGLSNADQFIIGYGMRSTGTTSIFGQTMNLRSAATVGPEIHIGCGSHNKDAATIYFNSHITDIRNGIKIGAEYATSADRLNLVVYTSNNGTSPYTPSWSPTLKVTYTGRVGIGVSAPAQKLHVDGSILSTGDQVVSSDLTKKTNLIPINLKVEQIAAAPAVTFDWKTGGHSFGSIAQYWKDVLGEAVLGTEGNYALAYGQLALVNTIVEAREIDKLKARVAELEAEVKRLTAN